MSWSDPCNDPLPAEICLQFDNWLAAEGYEAAVECCMWCSAEGGFQGADCHALDLIGEFEESLQRELTDEEQAALEDHCGNIGEVANTAAWNAEHEQETEQ